jgi:hypothetical protein
MALDQTSGETVLNYLQSRYLLKNQKGILATNLQRLLEMILILLKSKPMILSI